MGKILDAFVDDQLHVNAVTAKRTSHHQYLCEQVEILQSKLEKKLNDEDKELLKKFADTYFGEFIPTENQPPFYLQKILCV